MSKFKNFATNIYERDLQDTPDNDIDNVYYNLSITNTSNVSIPAKFTDIKNQSILDDPWNYYMTIARFSIPNQSTPMVQNWPDNRFYITLFLNGTPYSAPVNYISYNSLNQRYVYSYQHICDMVNLGFNNAFVLIPVLLLPAGLTQAPYITFDTNSAKYSLWCQQTYDPTINPITVQIWFNNLLYYLFDNWNVFSAGEQQANHMDYRMIIQNTHINIPVTPAGYYQFQQEYQATFNLQQLKSIRFISNLIPVRPEYVPSELNENNNELNSIQIVTDFEPNSETGSASVFRNVLQYVPSGEYRLIDGLHSTPLSKIDVSVFWVDTVGDQFQIMVPPNDSITIKFLFIKKSLYKYQYKLLKC